mmetsp:Transcript_21232/g.30758  ORF Transcript_21232/g.30758 Transcript_21232/m.30758 type:complete len:549 (-) Transcript_21232:229-1875(-)
MTLHELESPEAVQTFTQTNANALICFSATWCGPCSASKPTLEEMASSYEKDPSVDVKVGIAYEHNLNEAIHQYNVRAFPTYVLFVKSGEVGRVEGVNFDGIKGMVEKAGCKKELGEGHSLGGGGAVLSPEEARAQRLARFGAPAAAPKPTPEPAGDESKDVKMDEPAADETKDVEMTDASASSAPAQDASASEEKEQPEMIDPTASLSKADIETLTGSMGFSVVRAQKGLLNGGGTVEGAVEWLMEHQDDADIDDPVCTIAGGPGVVAQSYKCNECGKILSNMANLELHANKTGHSDFEESTTVVKPLTAEEKAAKIEEIKNLLKAKRTEREFAEKEEQIDREKQRRFMGKEMAKTREELEREQRRREVQKRRREKEEQKRERDRIRAELAKDRMERQANKGKLQSSLGVEGYNPSAIQYDVPAVGSGGKPQQNTGKAPKASSAKIDEYIKKVSSYRAGGDGGKCLKILLAYVKNVVDKPDEEKFKSINMENKAFKTKVKPFVGAKSLLLAVGFAPSDGGDALVLKEDADRKVLEETKGKLEAAFAAY